MKSHLPLQPAPIVQEKAPLSPCGRHNNAERAEKLRGHGQLGGGRPEKHPQSSLRSNFLTGQLAGLGEEQRPLGALRAAFGPRVDGLRIEEGKSAENEAIGAEAHAEGSVVRLSGSIDADNPEKMGLLAHEVAHALAPQGQAEELDQPGDPGEAKAEEAGSRFEAWASTGFEGPAPQLQPATGGRAKIQRSQSEDAPSEEAITEEGWLDPTLSGLSRAYQFRQDMGMALGQMPLHAPGGLGETLKQIGPHLPMFIATFAAFWLLEAGVAALLGAPEPTLVTKALAVLIQAILLAFAGYGVVVEATEAAKIGWEGTKKVWEAEADPQKISEASILFCRMLLHAVLAVLAILALRGVPGRGVVGKGAVAEGAAVEGGAARGGAVADGAAVEGAAAKGGLVPEGATAKGGAVAEGGAVQGAADELALGIVEEEAVAARLAGKEEVLNTKSGVESPAVGVPEQVPVTEGKSVAESPTPSTGGARDLPETPPRIKISENDRRFGDLEDGAAHTLARHGPEVPLRRADAPPGARTIEGRLFGDPPWPDRQIYSYRWKNKGKLDDLLNEFIQKNWAELRLHFQSKSDYEGVLDAKQVIGEGFIDATGKKAPIPQPVYHQTSRLVIRLQFFAGPPPEVYVKTMFPLGGGV